MSDADLKARIADLEADLIRHDEAEAAGEVSERFRHDLYRQVGERVKWATTCEDVGNDNLGCLGDFHPLACERSRLLRELLGPAETRRQVDAAHAEALWDEELRNRPKNVNQDTLGGLLATQVQGAYNSLTETLTKQMYAPMTIEPDQLAGLDAALTIADAVSPDNPLLKGLK